jgi:CarD family transcriptional regulator
MMLFEQRSKGEMFMFKVNDYVVYGLTGVCQIIDIEKVKDTNNDQTDYYVLRPVYDNINNMIIKTPLNNPKILIRKVITKQEAAALMAKMTQKEPVWIEDNRERSLHFKTILKTGNCEELIGLIKTLYHEKEARSVEGKNITSTDEQIMKTAEKQLHEELAVALDLSPDEVVAYILEHLSS